MKKKQRTNVSFAQKEFIILELLKPECDLVSLSKKYKLARSTLIKWRNQYNRKQQDATSQTNSTFIEVKVERSKRVSTLKKVELSFDNYRCCIEGKLNSTQLLKLIELLEEVAC